MRGDVGGRRLKLPAKSKIKSTIIARVPCEEMINYFFPSATVTTLNDLAKVGQTSSWGCLIVQLANQSSTKDGSFWWHSGNRLACEPGDRSSTMPNIRHVIGTIRLVIIRVLDLVVMGGDWWWKGREFKPFSTLPVYVDSENQTRVNTEHKTICYLYTF